MNTSPLQFGASHRLVIETSGVSPETRAQKLHKIEKALSAVSQLAPSQLAMAVEDDTFKRSGHSAINIFTEGDAEEAAAIIFYKDTERIKGLSEKVKPANEVTIHDDASLNQFFQTKILTGLELNEPQKAQIKETLSAPYHYH